MNAQNVDAFIIANRRNFRDYHIPLIREILLKADESKWVMLQSLDFKDPTIALVISLLVGGLGIDRFYVGDIGLGVVKLITCGGAYIWTIVDWFLIMGVAKDKNMEKLQLFL